VQFLYEAADNERKPLVLSNLALERYCVLYNLGALYNQLAKLESRSSASSIKQASSFYQVRPLLLHFNI
jgi:programmed cell death 6-interacting protein